MEYLLPVFFVPLNLVAFATGPVAREDVLHELQLVVTVGLEEARREVQLQGAVHGRRVLAAHIGVVLRLVLRVRVEPQPLVRMQRSPRRHTGHPRR